jgi:hypothetical protein
MIYLHAASHAAWNAFIEGNRFTFRLAGSDHDLVERPTATKGSDFQSSVRTRSILAGIPPAVVLKASGHSSDEWKRYLNVTPEMLQDLLTPLDGQESETVKAYGVEVMRQLTEALMGSWKSSGKSEFFQDIWAKVAMQRNK